MFWSLEEFYYAGTVASYDRLSEEHVIQYDDGESETRAMQNEDWRYITNNRANTSTTTSNRKRKKTKKKYNVTITNNRDKIKNPGTTNNRKRKKDEDTTIKNIS